MTEYTPPLNQIERQKKYFADTSKPLHDPKETSKRFKYLLGLTSLFEHFIDNSAIKTNSKTPAKRKTEQEEDAELLNEDTEVITEFTESPGYIRGQMRPYQIDGLNWLVNLHENHLSGILADEMGLGKTLQTISFLGYLRYVRGISGPFLVISPKSTLDNWHREFSKWTPEVNAFVLQGDKETRQELIKDKLMACDFDVVIASYETIIKEKAAFRKFHWEYIVIDEAHRIKNEESMLSQIIREFYSRQRLLITGTPLQNNLHELWALLNFILPDVFGQSEQFDAWFGGEDDGSMVEQLHKVLNPFLLRRIKSDVETSLLPKKELNLYVGMSAMQKKWYQKLLEKDIDAVNGANGKKESKTRLLNIVMQLRKCCNHPYLFEGAEPGPPYTTDEHLIYNCQKLDILDKLLKKCKAEGSRVLIFSQMSRVLDILEDYCFFREFQYCRIDGSTDHADRIQAIDEYNAPDSEKFVFLLTTRAGGLGINLVTADVVVLYDSDWNPQADLQAMDRAHRIGQKKQVKVYRLITDNSVEEKILERATQKLRLDQLVIQQGIQKKQQQNQETSKGDLLSMIQFGAADVFKNDEKGEGKEEEIDLEAILAKSETKTQELSTRYSKLGLDDLQKFSSGESAYEWNGTNFKLHQNQQQLWINPAKRERKENYSVDMYYKDVLNPGSSGRPSSSQPRVPKQPTIYDHQFYPIQLQSLYNKEKAWYRKQSGYKPGLGDVSGTKEEKAAELKLLELEIKNAEPLTEEEEALKQELSSQGYSNISRRDFYSFISASTKYGRNSLRSIASEMPDKTLEEVTEYARAFWAKYREIDQYERYLSQIEAGEEKLHKTRLQKEALRRKMASCKYPLRDIQLQFPPQNTSKRVFTDEEDRYLLVMMYKLGLDREDLYERIRDSIRQSPLFTFDFFFQSRTPLELNRRAITLLACLQKEIQP